MYPITEKKRKIYDRDETREEPSVLVCDSCVVFCIVSFPVTQYYPFPGVLCKHNPVPMLVCVCVCLRGSIHIPVFSISIVLRELWHLQKWDCQDFLKESTISFFRKLPVSLCVGILPAWIMSVNLMSVWVLRRPEEGIGSPKTGVTDSCEQSCGGWEQNLVPWNSSQCS